MPKHEITKASPEAKYLSVAMHEVRHRMQHTLMGLNMFREGELPLATDPMVPAIAKVMTGVFAYRKRRLESIGASVADIQKANSQYEFDAETLDQIALHKYPSLADDKVLKELMYLQPGR